MLATEALRLTAIEALAPTACFGGGQAFPTMAGGHVYDSRAIAPDELDGDAPYTPSLSLHSDDATWSSRGANASSSIGDLRATLTVICELAVRSDGDDGTPMTDAMTAESDPLARLVLGALCSQVRRVLTFDPLSDLLRRKVVRRVVSIKLDQFALPEFGLRWMRTTMQFDCELRDDQYEDGAGVPEPIRSVMAALPKGSYALAKLQDLHSAFAAIDRTPLDGVTFASATSSDLQGSVDLTRDKS